MRGNLITGILLLIFSVIFWFGADAIPKSRLSGSVGADGLPKMLSIALAVLSGALIVQTLVTMKVTVPTNRTELDARAEQRALYLRALGIIVIGAGYLMLVPYLGYILTIALLLLTVALYNGKRLSVGLFLFAALGSAFFYVLFVQVLAVPLPAGFWPRLIA